MVHAERKFLGAAVVLVLVDGADIVLPFQLVFQLQSNDRNAVYRKHHINGVVVGRCIAELAGTAKDIGVVALHRKGVQVGFRLKIAHPQLAAHILDTVAQNIQQALIGNAGFQPVVQLVCRLIAVVFGVARPFFGLCCGDELAKHVHIDTFADILLARLHPMPVGILPVELGVAALRRNQKGFYVALKPFFAFVHQDTSSVLIPLSCQ